VVSERLWGQLRAGLSASAIQSGRLVSTESAAGADLRARRIYLVRSDPRGLVEQTTRSCRLATVGVDCAQLLREVAYMSHRRSLTRLVALFIGTCALRPLQPGKTRSPKGSRWNVGTLATISLLFNWTGSS
jgi:hypothetical protein